MAHRRPHRVAKFGLATGCRGVARRYTGRYRGRRERWFRDLDSNQDTQLQRLMSYRLDDPGMASRNCSRGMQACTDGSADSACAVLNLLVRNMAERVGFEPTVGFLLHTLSKRAP